MVGIKSFLSRKSVAPAAPSPPGIFSSSYNSSFSRTVILSFALLCLSSASYGFSDQTFASTQASNAFTQQFGDYNAKTKTWALNPVYLSLLNSLKVPAQIIGLYAGSFISNRYGRRMCIFLMSIYALCSTAIIISSQSKAQMLAGRSLHYFYLGMQLAVIPTMFAELSPRKYRGGIVVLYWLFIKIGGFVTTAISRSTSTDSSNLAWQIPVSLIFVIPVFVIPLTWFMPESPRWLLLQDRREDALANMIRLRQGKISDEEIRHEMYELEQATAELQQNGRFWDIFRSPNRRRTWVVVMLGFFQQGTGQSFASQYGTLFVKALNTVNPFNITLATNGVDIGALLICVAATDIFGRRLLLNISTFLQFAALMTMGALGTLDRNSNPIKEGIVAMLLLFSFAWSLGSAPITYVISAELPSPAFREDTIRVAYTVKLVMEFLVSFTYPYLESTDYADLGGKLGFIYGSIAFCGFIFVVYCVPETKNLELEDIDRQSRLDYGIGEPKDIEAPGEGVADPREVSRLSISLPGEK